MHTMYVHTYEHIDEHKSNRTYGTHIYAYTRTSIIDEHESKLGIPVILNAWKTFMLPLHHWCCC